MTRRLAPRLAAAILAAAFTALAGLAGLAGQAALDRTEGWRTHLAGEMTVALRPAPGADAAVPRAAEVLAGTPGVAEARALDRARVGALLAPWTAGTRGPDLAALPRLIAVDLDPRKPARRQDLADALSAAGIDAVVDDHQGWRRSALETRRRLAAPLIGALMLCVAGLVAAGGLAAGFEASRREAGLRTRLRLGASQLSCAAPIGGAVAIDLSVGVLAGGLIAAVLTRLSTLTDAEAAAGAFAAQSILLAAVMAGALLVALIGAFATAARRVRELEP